MQFIQKLIVLSLLLGIIYASTTTQSVNRYNIVDTNQKRCFNSYGSQISCKGTAQDGEFIGNTPNYTVTANATVIDNITGLIWQRSADTNSDGKIDVKDKMTQKDAIRYCQNLTLGGFDDWRLPDIKTMYSLIDFSGKDIDSRASSGSTPFIDNKTFEVAYGDISAGERIIDAQWATTTNYVSYTMNGNDTMFGVNFADGRIKGYPSSTIRGRDKLFYVQCVRGNKEYGKNNFVDNKNGTITDIATNLIWQKEDSKKPLKWEKALQYCSNLSLGGYDDWKLPNAKELQSIVDYTKSPSTTNSAAINPLFDTTSFISEKGEKDYGAYWSSTTHKNQRGAEHSVYVNFGKSLGYMRGRWMDVHGAGAQRSDPKDIQTANGMGYNRVTDANGDKAITHGPQGDVVRSGNFARCVRNVNVEQKRVTDAPKEINNRRMESDFGNGRISNQRREPPSEAIEACENKSIDESCRVQTPDGRSINGVCGKTPDGLKVCIPKAMENPNERGFRMAPPPR